MLRGTGCKYEVWREEGEMVIKCWPCYITAATNHRRWVQLVLARRTNISFLSCEHAHENSVIELVTYIKSPYSLLIAMFDVERRKPVKLATWTVLISKQGLRSASSRSPYPRPIFCNSHMLNWASNEHVPRHWRIIRNERVHRTAC